jgi:DNA polymerase III subunit epsilon
MLDWLKNIGKDYPEFWKDYLSKFDVKAHRFVAISTESSGLNTDKDVVFSIGCIGIVDNNVIISDAFEVGLLQGDNTTDIIVSNTFLNNNTAVKLSEPEALQLFIEYIENAVLVGHRIHYDVEMINKALDRMKCGRLKNEALDIEVMYQRLHDITDKQFTLDDLSKTYKIMKNDRHSAADDAYTISLLFLKLKSRLDIN